MFDISNSGLKKNSLEGEVAVITGSTSNVGKGFAQAIAWAGVMVSDVLKAMKYPFPCPETLVDHHRTYTAEMPLTLMFGYMIHGFPE